MISSARRLPSRGLGILLSALLLVVLGWTTPALAQGKLQLGQNGSGSLEDSDSTLDDDSFYDEWTYAGRAGETIRVTLKSSEFDAYLSVGRSDGEDFSELDSDDDGAGGTDSKVVVTLPEDGDYTVRVNSLSAGETGTYSVLVEQGDPSEVTVDGDDGEDPDGESVATPMPEPTPIQPGQAAQGALSEDDARMEDNSFYDLYTFQAKRGQRVTITMRSKDFDSYLAFGRIEDGSFNTLESDDDSGGGEDSKVEFNITRDGEYAIRANSLFENATGDYSLELEVGAAPPPVPLTFAAIRVGQTVNGELSENDPALDDDSHFDLYRFTGKKGDKLVITMKSTTFDTYLGIGRMENDEFSSMETNDDGAGGTDSRIEITLEEDGEYVIRANSLFARAMGAYTLNLARGR